MFTSSRSKYGRSGRNSAICATHCSSWAASCGWVGATTGANCVSEICADDGGKRLERGERNETRVVRRVWTRETRWESRATIDRRVVVARSIRDGRVRHGMRARGVGGTGRTIAVPFRFVARRARFHRRSFDETRAAASTRPL